MTSFIDQFEEYADCIPPGVRLPKIEITDKQYKSINADSSISNYDFLRKLCLAGVKSKGIDKQKNAQEYYDRAKEELSILKELGFIDYILLNWDILNFCHENDIPTGPGRGSAAGCLVLYLIDVTKIDPIKYDLFLKDLLARAELKKSRKMESHI